MIDQVRYRLLCWQVNILWLAQVRWLCLENYLKEKVNTMDEIKPGVKTSEFYMPTIMAALGLLVSLGLLTTPLADEVATAIAAAVPAAVGLIGAVSAAVNYIRGRVTIKTSVLLKEVE